MTDTYILPRAALAVAGACLLVAWALALPVPSLGRLALPALAVVGAALLAAIFSVAPAVSIVGAYSRYESLTMRLAYVALFAGTAWLARTPAARRRILTAFIAACVVASIEAIYEAATGDPPRPDGNLGQANLLGGLLAMAIPITCARVVGARLWGLALLPLVAGLVLSSSRSGWLGALAGTVLLVPLLARSDRWRPRLLAAAVGIVALGLAAILLSPLSGLNSDSGSARLHVWRDSLPLIAERPLTGHGEDTLGLVFGRYVSGNWEPGATFDRLHQNELDLLATQGLLGLAACTWLFGTWLLTAWRRNAGLSSVETAIPAAIAGWAGYLVFVQLNFDWVPATGPLWMIAGVGWAAVLDSDPVGAPPTAPRPVRLLALPALAAAAVVLGVLPILADAAAHASDPRAATSLDPYQARYARQLGEMEIGPDPRMAVRNLQRAVALGDYDSTTYIELGDAQLGTGDPAGARRAYRRALEIDPFNNLARVRLSALH